MAKELDEKKLDKVSGGVIGKMRRCNSCGRTWDPSQYDQDVCPDCGNTTNLSWITGNTVVR